MTSIPATIIAVDGTDKWQQAQRAIDLSLKQVQCDKSILLRPELKSLGDYSNFCIREMAKHVKSEFALVVQGDGYVLNGNAWTDEFLKYDYIGAPYNPSGVVGNGGFSLRSKRLLDWLASRQWPDNHPEDSAICIRHRQEVETAGFKFAPPSIAGRFAIEGRSWDSREWKGTPNRWTNELGFHSWLTPGIPSAPNVFHHSGDQGDVIYSLPVIQRLGGGVLFLSPSNNYPYPFHSRWTRTGGEAGWVDNLAPLIEAQEYVWSCKYTHGTPYSTTHDLNMFRLPWKHRTARDFDSILKLHCDAFNVPVPTAPWLSVREPIVVDGRPIVISRSQRYQNDKFPWYEFVQKHHSKMVFVGTAQEAGIFQGFAVPHKIPHFATTNALELARVIAGAKACVMNQSLPLAIAHGLHKTVVCEEWPLNRNCRVPNPNAVYSMPSQWL